MTVSPETAFFSPSTAFVTAAGAGEGRTAGEGKGAGEGKAAPEGKAEGKAPAEGKGPPPRNAGGGA